MDQLTTIKNLIHEGCVDKAIETLSIYLSDKNSPSHDEAYYLLGNAFRKQGNWQQALNNYQLAIDINPESPAADARKMVIDILNFYNKDMYNQ
ncbi:tetratricopeptide repeat protein [Bacteroides sp. 519]|uniref:tetratricopeptide repeat protein n=1 Tax=Bacteroides sp. 519 TaxID=2302937 RepID=UPI0013D12350|nr:tetratricopeptide repeat protein [Bacteroides sp. 519]NDV59703.1 tetratricopeptide repeat protein [Bacteroides sp. 519]